MYLKIYKQNLKKIKAGLGPKKHLKVDQEHLEVDRGRSTEL